MEDGGRGTHVERCLSHRPGEDQDQPAAGQHQPAAVEGDDQADAQDGARNGKRSHGDDVEQVRNPRTKAGDGEADGDPDHRGHDRGGSGQGEGVDQRPRGLIE